MNSLFKKTLIFATVMALVAVAGWFGRKTYKQASEARMIQQARDSVAKKDWRGAGLSLQRALQINPNGIEASKLMADLMDASQAPSALSWRMRAAQLEPHSADLRFAWAKTALRVRDFTSAGDALSGVDAQSKSTAVFHKLSGGLEQALNRSTEAEKHYLEALRLEPTNQVTVINLASLRLSSTNAGAADKARATLKQMATNEAVRSIALDRLKTDATFRKAWPEALAYSGELVRDPKASLEDRMDHLQLLRRSKSRDYDSLLKTLKSEATKSSETAFAVGRWMAVTEGPTNTLRWIESLPVEVRTNAPVPMVTADCLILVKNWTGLVALLESGEWGQAESYRWALLSLGQRSLGQKTAADASWRRAMRRATPHLDQLSRLVQVAESSGWQGERKEVLRAITDSFPKERWAVDGLIQQLYLAGDTRAIYLLLSKVHSANPADPMVGNNLAYVCLLLQTDLEKAHRLAAETYKVLPADPSVISTYAYSLFVQGRPGDAATILKQLSADSLKSPTVAACFSVIHAKAGNKTVAQAPLTLAEAARMLPEEKEMVRLARASL